VVLVTHTFTQIFTSICAKFWELCVIRERKIIKACKPTNFWRQMNKYLFCYLLFRIWLHVLCKLIYNGIFAGATN